MGKINLLSFEVANLIAAGEVVDRPSSAVKELLENAIDSGASQITLEIQRGGISFIRVFDNGCGIERDDLRPAITRHSTSKISRASDLDSIMTLGFRGEALAAIASVSHLRIFSKTPENPLGALLEADGGRIRSISDTGCQDGTCVIVEDLFFNVPARRKFLKKDSTEAAAVGAVVEKTAISRPDISFKYISDGEIKFMTSGNGDLRETIWALFGKDTASRTLKVDREEGGIHVTGYVSEPDFIRSNRNMENFFINNRYIKSKTASAALEQAYSSKIPQEKFPFCALNIDLNPAAVDVNVHPAKLEVKFANEKLIFDAVYYAVLSALESAVVRPEFRLPDRKAESANPYMSGAMRSSIINASLPLDKPMPKAEQVRLSDYINGNAGYPAHVMMNPQQTAKDNVPIAATTDTPSRSQRADKAANMSSADVPELIIQSNLSSGGDAARQYASSYGTLPNDVPLYSTPSDAAHQTYEREPGKAAKSDPYADYCEDISPDTVPEYSIIGEAFNCYVMVQLTDRLLMIDKHAAHERIIFDELCRKLHTYMKNGVKKNGQVLLTPIELEVLGAESVSLEEYGEKIKALGFDYTSEKNGVSSYRIMLNEIPATLEASAAVELFNTLVTKLTDSTASVESASVGFFETRLWQASCKAAIKGGRVYDIAHIKWICDRLLKKPDVTGGVIRTCPHGRPVAFEIKKSSIDRQFSRLT